MELFEFVNSDVTNRLHLDINKYFPEALAEHFKDIRSHLKKLNPKNKLYQEILKRLDQDYLTIENGVLNTLNLYYQGNLIDSLSTFNKLLEWLDHYYWDAKEVVDLSEFPNVLNATPRFYRCRVAKKTPSSSIESILHVPFENRNMASLGRFNLAGMPCLYLGKSIHACWEELKRPLYEDIITAKFEIKQGTDYKILNLADPPFLTYQNFEFFLFLIIFQSCKFLKDKSIPVNDEIQKITNILFEHFKISDNVTSQEFIQIVSAGAKSIDYLINEIFVPKGISHERLIDIFHFDIESQIYHYFPIDDFHLSEIKKSQGYLQTAIALVVNKTILYPLRFAISLKVDNYFHAFKPEYILGQFLMQWLFKKNQQETSLYGLSYLSSRTPSLSRNRSVDLNLYKNYSFPSVPQKSGYCNKILDSFVVTNIIDLAHPPGTLKKDSFNKDGKIYTYSRDGIDYKKTFLYEMEMTLEEMSLNDISSFKR